MCASTLSTVVEQALLIIIRLARDSHLQVRELECRGHAGFDDGTGTDLVCAGVSAVLGALALGLVEVAHLPVTVTAGDGEFHAMVPEGMSQEEQARTSLLMETAVRALQQLNDHYPGFLEIRSTGICSNFE